MKKKLVAPALCLGAVVFVHAVAWLAGHDFVVDGSINRGPSSAAVIILAAWAGAMAFTFGKMIEHDV